MPKVYASLLHRLRDVYRTRWKYRHEQNLLNNKLSLRSNRRSVLFFTTHKCASTYIPKCLAYLNRRYMRMRLIDLEGLIWHRHDVNIHEHLSTGASRLFHERGVIYAPLRRYINFDRRERFRSILFLRDPRDVLVSHYYSTAFSHGLPANPNRRDAFLSKRSTINLVDIDQYVVKMCDTFLPIYEEYSRELVSPGGAFILLYDTFINDFRLWVSQLAEALDIEITPADIEHLWLLKGGDIPSSENVHAHIRSGATGGHKDKLSAETLRILDDRFCSILESIDFDAVNQTGS